MNPGVIWRGAQVPLSFPQILGKAPYGGNGGRVLRINLLRGERRDTGGPTVAHHLQYSGGFSGLPLGVFDGRRV